MSLHAWLDNKFLLSKEENFLCSYTTVCLTIHLLEGIFLKDKRQIDIRYYVSQSGCVKAYPELRMSTRTPLEGKFRKNCEGVKKTAKRREAS